jgi:hypothetical protein
LAKKDDKKKTVEELNSLFKPVEQKVAKGAVWLFKYFHAAFYCYFNIAVTDMRFLPFLSES